MYVCYFEEIIRAILKDPKFTLPYWNYTVPAGYAVPKEFRMQNDPLWGPLYRPNRNPTSNAGQPIFAAGGSASDMSPAPAMAECSPMGKSASQRRIETSSDAWEAAKPRSIFRVPLRWRRRRLKA